MIDLFLGIFVWAAATGISLRIFKITKVDFAAAGEALTFSSGIGLGLLAYAVFVIGSLKMLYAPPMVVLLILMFLFSLRSLVSEVTSVLKDCKPAANDFFSHALYFLPVLVVLIFSLAGTLAPPIGQDELCYHLAQPKNYLREHAIYEVPYSTSALWPYLMEMLFTLGLLLRGPELAKFFHFAMFLTAGSAVYCFVKRFSGHRAALFSALVFLMTPAVFIQSSFAYVDNALACYSFMAFYALFVYSRNSRLSWAVLAGVLTGLAVSVKFIGLFIVPILLMVFLLIILRSHAGSKLRSVTSLACFMGAAFLSGGLWYARAAVLRGNPVFPFYPQWFGGHGWHIDTYVNAHGKGRDFFSFVRLFWDTALYPKSFGGEQIGPFYLAFVPLVFFIRPLPTFVKYSLVFGAAYSALWFAVDPNIRFFFPALALFSVGAGTAMAWLSESKSKAFRTAVYGLYFLMFSVQASFAIYHFKEAAGLCFRTDRQRYASEHDRSFNAARIINGHLKPGDKLISVGEVRGYHFNAPFSIEGEVNRFTDYGRKLSSVGQVRDFLRREGFTHVLYFDQGTSGETRNASSMRLPSLFGEGRCPRDYFKETIVLQSGGARYVLYEIL